ncbi:hypothetical protein D3C76_1193310 [compost metagenome]
MILFVAEGDRTIEGIADRAVLQRDQVILGQRLALMGLPQQLDEALGLVRAGGFTFDGEGVVGFV